ncbi:MAG TPA: hypothetical protein VIB39_12255 [Candidatus Angelobacter sp.]|jgi:hypothetical protein
MSFIDNFRKEKSKEKKGALSIRRGVERAREEWADLERKLRQRMRIYPQKSRAMAAGAPGGTTFDVDEGATSEGPEPRTPIVSVHGHDLRDD